MVTWGLVLETAIKWLIPVICVAIVGLITAHFIKPFKSGNQLQQQQNWDMYYKASQEPQLVIDRVKKEMAATVKEADKEILDKIDKLTSNIEEENKVNRENNKKINESIELIQDGVKDAHLQNLIATCEVYIKRGYITATELEAYQSRYNLYKKLGGNGHMDPWDKAIKALPHEPNKNVTQTVVSTHTTTPPRSHL